MLIIIYIDEMIIIGRTRKEMESTRDILIYLLQHLGFLLVFKEICASAISENKTSRHYSKFCISESLTPYTEDAEGPGGVHKDVQQELDIDFGLTKLLGLLSSII